MRLTADADPRLWIPVTDSLGWRGRRHRKAAIRMLLGQVNAAVGATERPGSRFGAWAMSQAAPMLMKQANGRVLVWTWKAEPELIVAMASAQALTPELRIARASMPMEHDDTQSFPTRLGVGEKLLVPLPTSEKSPPFATYTWDTGTHLVTLTAVCSDRERFGTVTAALDDLARSIRIADDLTGGESHEVLRLDPA
ncbi:MULTISPECIES: hypothetical protein [unclassified Microbacterium]|uniref:hypothetical protein n=1 Tax=unclassified Microbacterium TaxID=2609290 RepID=UPI000EA8C6E8|nr:MULTISPECIES: hypothetical protein [unclassified Microbacterium]MBT2483786.1 hypothetical protein [Microbacterium sp. ISL-108]RKN66772.1 hypothetical protein D7252_03630 [Microbacterium sp. CGR2]